MKVGESGKWEAGAIVSMITTFVPWRGLRAFSFLAAFLTYLVTDDIRRRNAHTEANSGAWRSGRGVKDNQYTGSAGILPAA